MPSLRELLGFGKSEGANNLVILNGYPLAVVVAISLHILLLGGLVYLQSSSQSQALELIQPTVIKALLIEENPQITNQRNQDNRRLEAKRKETERANAAAKKKREEQKDQANTNRLSVLLSSSLGRLSAEPRNLLSADEAIGEIIAWPNRFQESRPRPHGSFISCPTARKMDSL